MMSTGPQNMPGLHYSSTNTQEDQLEINKRRRNAWWRGTKRKLKEVIKNTMVHFETQQKRKKNHDKLICITNNIT